MGKQTITVIKARHAVEAKHYEEALKEAFDIGGWRVRADVEWIRKRARELAHAEQEKQE